MGATESKDRLVGSPSFGNVPAAGFGGEATGSVPEPPQTPQLKCAVPVAFRWHHGASREVYVVGSFSNWQTKIRLTREPVGDAYATVVQIVPGIHQYKFIVDGEWRCAQVCPKIFFEQIHFEQMAKVPIAITFDLVCARGLHKT